MELLERALLSLVLVAGLLLLVLATRRRRLPPPPRVMPLVAVLLWCLLSGSTRPAGLRWLGAVDELAIAYALIGLLAWLTLECPAALGWWRPTAKILRDLLNLGLSAVATVLVLQRQANLNLVGLVTTSAVLTAVIGLAAQESLKDLFAGIELQVDPPFREGDWISVGDESGTVDSLHLMSTRLRRIDGSTVNLPNNTVVDTPMQRFSQNGPVGNRFGIALGYEIPPARARQLLEAVMADNPLVLQAPPPEVWIRAYEDSQIRYELLAFHRGASEEERLRLRSGLLEQIWYALERQGWELPYPVRELQRRVARTDPSHPGGEDATLTGELLRRSWLFAQLDPALVDQLASSVRCLRFGPGETIVAEGQEGDALFQVVQGEVEVFKADGSPLGRSVAVLGSDQIFGEMTVCTGEPRTATVRSRNECVLLEVERHDFLPLVEADAGLVEALAAIVGRRRTELEKLSSPDAARRQTSILERMRHLFGIEAD
ncbi:mechanosensitive ion channel family protein [Synechococcus sp. CCY 9618]|uniref:mechanosensitive ion channel family protein n=1 Tax=Synechococcus sp. CCY 9618 TaxID=2815602 RepID=UPI001C237F1B|nr:mechanosensitive ion channel family protein [Synechococcus sp. CCY 9618]